MKRDFQIAFLRSVGLKPEHVLLDIGCGTLRGGIPIIEYLDLGNYYGVEARAELLPDAQNELRDHGLEQKRPTLLAGDVTRLAIDHQFDFLWAFSTLIHMHDEVLDGCFQFAKTHLKPHGVFYANVNIGSGYLGVWKEFPVVARSLSFYENAAANRGLFTIEIGALKELGHSSGVAAQDEQRMLKFTKVGQSSFCPPPGT